MNRIKPKDKYHGKPCSYVGTGCAYEDIFKKDFTAPLPEGLEEDGYLSLDNENKYIRSLLPIKRRTYYKRTERYPLKDFLQNNEEKACVCVYGHFIYVNGHNYYSFFDNLDDPVICIWYIKEDKKKENNK